MGVNEVAQNVTIVCSRLIKLLRHAETPFDNESGSPLNKHFLVNGFIEDLFFNQLTDETPHDSV
jgi:hypothetical protein